jgi:hypothetical protein
MLVVGKVVNFRVGFEGSRQSERPDLITLYLYADGDEIPVVCRRCHCPHEIEHLEQQIVVIDVRLQEIRLSQDPRAKEEILYKAENYPGVVHILGRAAVRHLGRLRFFT